MNSLDLEQATIGEISPYFKRKKVSPVELTEFVLAKTKKLNPVLNAYVTITEEVALADAQVAEREIQQGRYRGPLHGGPGFNQRQHSNSRSQDNSRVENSL